MIQVSDLVRIPFHGDELLTVDVDGTPHVVLRPALESLGLDYSAQLQKLRTRSWAVVGQNPTTGADGKTYKMVTVDARTLMMLLASVDENRVASQVRDKLIAYQSEVADVIESYWRTGGAINPRATQDQTDDLQRRISIQRAQASVLAELQGVVSQDWLDAKGRVLASRALGDEPEIDPERRPLTVSDYLTENGIDASTQRKIATKFGKYLKAAYRDQYGCEPSMTDRFVDGAVRSVAAYTEQHRPLFDWVWTKLGRG